MKKISTIILFGILVVLLSGCEQKQIQKENITRESISCILVEKNSQLKQEYKFEARNNQINHIVLSITYDQVNEITDFSTFTEDQKINFEAIMLNAIGIENSENEGLEIKIDFNKKLTVTIDADLEKADEELLKTVGLDAENIDLDYKRAVEDLKNTGATCQ